jgi:hypothetical protein
MDPKYAHSANLYLDMASVPYKRSALSLLLLLLLLLLLPPPLLLLQMCFIYHLLFTSTVFVQIQATSKCNQLCLVKIIWGIPNMYDVNFYTHTHTHTHSLSLSLSPSLPLSLPTYLPTYLPKALMFAAQFYLSVPQF